MNDIPLRAAQILWHSRKGPLPAVKLVRHGVGTHLPYDRSWGANDQGFREATDIEQLNLLFRQFIYMTVCEGLDPFELHLTLMDIPEYREAMGGVAKIDPDLVALWQNYPPAPKGSGRRAGD